MAYEFEYLNLLDSLLQRTAAANRDGIPALAQKLADTIRSDRIIHMFGTGHSHMAGIELFCRAGGLGPVDVMLDPDCLAEHGARRSCALERLTGLADVIYDQYVISPGDIMIITSNSGRKRRAGGDGGPLPQRRHLVLRRHQPGPVPGLHLPGPRRKETV
jgi:uncharacterized phosphosugar-binding protein